MSDIIFRVDNKQAYLALHGISYHIMAALRLYKKDMQIQHQNEYNKIDYRLSRIKDRPNFVERPQDLSLNEEEIERVIELYEALEPSLYIFDKHFSEYVFVFDWLKSKVAKRAEVKTYKTCWCAGCPLAREHDIRMDSRFHTNIPPAVDKLTNTGITPPPAGMFYSHDKIKKRLADAEVEAIKTPEAFYAFYDEGMEKLLKQPFTEELDAKMKVIGFPPEKLELEEDDGSCGYHDYKEKCYRCCKEEDRCKDSLCEVCNPWQTFEKEVRLGWKKLGKIFPDLVPTKVNWEEEFNKIKDLL